MVDLTAQPGPVVTSQAPSSGVSLGDIERPYSELANTLNKTGEASEAIAETAAEKAGMNAVTRDADGNLQIEKFPIIGPASQAYSRAMKIAALAEGEGAAKDKDIELRTQFRDDPQGYLVAANAYKDQTVADYTKQGAPEVGMAMGRAIDSSTTFTFRGLLNEKERLDLARASESIDAGIASARDDVMALARGGDTSSPAFVQAMDKIHTLTNEKVTNPRLAYPADKAAYDLQQLDGETRANVFLHHVDQVYQDKGTNDDGSARGGAANALEAARSVLTDPSLKLTEPQRQQYFQKATAEIRANEAMRRQDVQEARAAEQSLNMISYGGGRVDPEDVEQVASAYRAAGDPASAARLYAKYARKPLNDDYGRQPLSEQTTQLNVMRAGANPNSSAEARLIGFESGGNPAKVNQFGYAGLYQFGAPLLADLGIYKPGAGESLADWKNSPATAPGKWSGTFNVPGFPEVKTIKDFLGNPAAQKAAFDAHTANMDAAIAAQGLDKYEGTSVGGVPITRDGLHAMIHLGGVQGTLATLQSGGRTNPADANGTSLLDYARLGATSAMPSPAANLWLATNRTTELQKNSRNAWSTIMADYEKTGVRPADTTLNQVIDAAHATNDHALLDHIGADIDRMDTSQRLAQSPLPAQGAALGSLKAAGAAGALTPGQSGVLRDLERKNAAITTGLAENPISTTVQNFPDRFGQPGPLNLKDPEELAAGLQQRAKIAQFAAQNWQTGPNSALDAADLKQIQGALDTNDPAVKAQIFSGLATLPPDVRAATLKKLGGNDPATMADAAAGSLMRSAPEIAQSIFRGQNAMKANPKTDPEHETSGKASYAADLDKNLPSTIFSLPARTNPSGDYATMAAMVKARYADLSAQDGKTDYSAPRVEQAVNDVTGGVLAHNGAKIIAPSRGMSQPQFDSVMQGITDKDLAGVTTLNGQPITPGYLRGAAHLESVGEGRYLVTLGGSAEKPIYAFQYANTERPTPFVLDLRGRQPGQLAFQPPEIGATF